MRSKPEFRPSAASRTRALTLLSLGQMAAALVVALAIDRWWGEPPLRWHPVVWMGRYLAWAGPWVAPQVAARNETLQMSLPRTIGHADWLHFARGSAAWCLGAVSVVALAAGVQTACVRLAFECLLPVVLGAALKPMLAWAMLKREVASVERAVQLSLAHGRTQLSHLVSRDVDKLDESAVRESAIESLSENLNDSVVAPLFWFAVFGLPGAALYRFANTADAMWGYRGSRNGQMWEWGGKWAARADDLLSWVPARITAALLMVVGVCLSAAQWHSLRREAARTPSPNSGWPMAAMALVLGVRLEKPESYVLNGEAPHPKAGDIDRAIAVASRLVSWVALVACGLALAGALDMLAGQFIADQGFL